MFSWFARLFKGLIIALGFILPGVSGGVLASILGLYHKIISFLAHPRQDFFKNCLYFLPVGIGGILGIALFSAPLAYLLQHYQVPVLWAFTGSILGTFPTLWQEAKQESKSPSIDISLFISSFILSGLFLYFLTDLVGTLTASFASFILAGALIALGILLPGLSPSNLLLILGLYTPMLTGFKELQLGTVFLPIALGGLLTMILFSKAMDYALLHHHAKVYHIILGLVSSSTLLIVLPNPRAIESISYAGTSPATYFLAGLLFLFGLVLGRWMSHLEEVYK